MAGPAGPARARAAEEATGIGREGSPVEYPFRPKSNRWLEPGQFWAVPLWDGRFACGRVLEIARHPDPHVPAGTKLFLAGLLDWFGTEPPTARAIAGAGLLSQGFAHIRTIHETGGEILGTRDLTADGLVPASWRSHEGGGTVWVYQGIRRVRPAGPEDAGLPVIGTWGFTVIARLAERAFVAGRTLPAPGRSRQA